MLLEAIVPEYDFGEVHAARLAVPPEGALRAVKLVGLGEMPLARVLFAVRSVPAYVAGRRGLPVASKGPLYRRMLDLGFVPIGEESGRELVVGGIGQMFRASGGRTPVLRLSVCHETAGRTRRFRRPESRVSWTTGEPISGR